MAIFGRRRAKQETTQSGVVDAEPDTVEDDAFEGSDLLTDEPAVELTDELDDEHEMEWNHSRVRGPFDRSEVDSDEGYLDLGGLWVPAVEGMQLRLEVDEASQTILGAQVVFEPSVIQLQAYAAPRTVGVWREIRTEIGQGVLAQGGKVEVTDGPFGKQLTATLKGGAVMRFFGVDGPRWFLRGVLSGPAATDDSAADRLVEVMRKTVVVRGSEAMAPRELLPMQMPTVPTDDAGESPEGASELGGDDGGSAERPAPRVEDLKPFARGPEITEVR